MNSLQKPNKQCRYDLKEAIWAIRNVYRQISLFGWSRGEL